MEASAWPTASQGGENRRWSSYVVRGLATVVVLLIPLLILWLGWRPPDDALRHAAKAVSGREWAEVLVLREGAERDSHPGWHAILTVVHRVTGVSASGLVVLSVLGLCLAVLLPGVLLLRAPEAWLMALLVTALTDPSRLIRLEAGRPFLVMTSLVATLCLLYPRHSRGLGREAFAVLAATFAVVAWIHPSWYLFLLVPTACALTCQVRLAVQITAALALGVALGGALTGHPVGFIADSLNHLSSVFGHAPPTTLVAELRPQIAPAAFPLSCLAIMGWRAFRGRWTSATLANPVFALALLGWVLGLAVRRFWADWGFPAALVWLAFEFQEALEESSRSHLGRLAMAVAVSIPLLLAATIDYGGRFTSRDRTLDCLAELREGDALPGPGGVLYSRYMQVFNEVFFRRPRANFRYVVGYEPGLMRADDLAVYGRLIRGEVDAYREWAERMRPEDRLLIVASSEDQLPAVGLDWSLACGSVWSGRVRRTPSRSGASSTSSESASRSRRSHQRLAPD